MSQRIVVRLRGFGLLLALAVTLPLLAADTRAVVGKHTSAAAMLLQSEGSGKAWQAVKQGAALSSGDMLVGLPGAVLESKNGAIQLALLSDLEGTSIFPVLESAVVLHDSKTADLDFTLDRGRIAVTNKKDKGTAKVVIRFGKEVWDLTLNEPGTQVGLELYGRWPRGVFFNKDDKPAKSPTSELVLIVLKGSAELKAGNRQLGLTAPPGPAFFHWDSVVGPDQGSQRLEKLPPWADPSAPPTAEAKEKLARIAQLREKLEKGTPNTVIAEWIDSKNAGERRGAVIALGGVDNVAGLIDALNNEKHADVRDNAIMVLRHWIGRGPGQDLKLYNALIEKKYSPVHADLVLRMLHSFGEVDLGLPETYEALIAYLSHDKLAIRELARWHLARLVPAGKKIPYEATAPAKDRETAIKEWQKLVPEGKLPPKARD